MSESELNPPEPTPADDQKLAETVPEPQPLTPDGTPIDPPVAQLPQGDGTEPNPVLAASATSDTATVPMTPGDQGDPGDETVASDSPPSDEGAKAEAVTTVDGAPIAEDADPAELEHEIGRYVEAATRAGNWEPAAAERCRELALRIVELRGSDAELPGSVSRWLP